MKKEFKLSTRESYSKDGIRSIKPIETTFTIKSRHGDMTTKLTKEDVCVNMTILKTKELTTVNNGMIVARDSDTYFEDVVPHKSVTVVCPKSQFDEVVY